MATFLAHIQVNPGREADFENVAGRLYTATHAGETAMRRYEYWRGAAPSTYYAFASFDDYPGFIAHQVSDHHMTAGSELTGMFASFTLEWVDPLPHASGLAPTVSTAPPADATELAASYHARMPAEEQAWWRLVTSGPLGG